MERDPRISKLIRESGVEPAPEGFTGKVMDIIAGQPVKKVYKPLIGKGGRIMIILFVIAIVVISLFYAEPAEQTRTIAEVLPKLNWKMPEFNIHFEFLSHLNLSGMNLSTWLVSVLAAVLVLLLSDAWFGRQRLSH